MPLELIRRCRTATVAGLVGALVRGDRDVLPVLADAIAEAGAPDHLADAVRRGWYRWLLTPEEDRADGNVRGQ